MGKQEWIQVPGSDEYLHETTVAYRVDELGWSKAEAASTPVQPHKGKEGKPNAAARAREALIRPSAVQLLMRQYGCSVDEAIAYMKAEIAASERQG